MITINFDNTFEPVEVAEDISYMTFYTTLQGGGQTMLKIEVKPLVDPLLPNVYNLCFGPIGDDGEINDSVSVPHLDINKVFSTIILFALTFLQTNRNITIGLDGSNETRAYLYHRMFVTNRAYLSDYFVAIGVDWYVKLLRTWDIERTADNKPFFKPKPEIFDYDRPARDMYRYYMFHLLPE